MKHKVYAQPTDERDPAEDRIQADLYTWFRNEWPQYKRLLCYNFSNSRNAIEGNKNRSMGLIKGRSDMTFYWQGQAYMIELKTPDGVQRPDQKYFEKDITDAGFKYCLIRSVEEGQNIIYKIMSAYPDELPL